MPEATMWRDEWNDLLLYMKIRNEDIEMIEN